MISTNNYTASRPTILSMESENKNFPPKNIDRKDLNLAAARRRFKRLILVFKFLFFALALIIGSLIIYLVRDIASDLESDRSIHINYPTDRTFDNLIVNTEFDTQSLERAAEELEDVLKYLASNTDTTALKTCRVSLLNVSGQIRRAVEANRVMAISQIRRAEGSIKACLDDLEKVESTVVIRVRAKVLRAKVYLRDWGDFLDDNTWRKKLSGTIAASRVLFQNLFLVSVGVYVLPLVFIIILLCIFSKIR